MGDLTLNISRYEIACKCKCGFDTIDFKTIHHVQGACDYFAAKLQVQKVTLLISSGARCPIHNANEGGADNSQHLLGRAIDHSIREISIEELHAYYIANFPNRYGIGLYLGPEPFVHFDTRSNGVWRKS